MILKRISYYLMALSAIAVGLYPVVYFIVPDRRFGLLASKSAELLADVLWNSMFYTHIILGGIALLIGWIQFSKRIRKKNISAHRNIGKVYVFSVLLSAVSGFYIALHATGGIGPKIGFSLMAIVWFYTTYRGLTSIKNKDIITHQKMMIYSYAACLSAVTLRIWLPLLGSYFGEFLPAYRIVAWLSWIPNLIIAYFIINKQFKTI